MNLPPEKDIDHSWMWHHTHWNMGDAVTSDDTGDQKLLSSPTNIIKYQKADWLDGLRDRKLPTCLLPWPLVRIDEYA